VKVNGLNLNYFRCFEKKEIKFKPNFNLLVGENGIGKTSVLDALRILLAQTLSQITDAPKVKNCKTIKSDITIGRLSLNISTNFSYLDKEYALTLFEHLEETVTHISENKGVKQVADQDSIVEIREYKRPKDGDVRLEGTMRGQTSGKNTEGLLFPRPSGQLKKVKNKPLVLFLSVQRSISNQNKITGSLKHLGYRNNFDYNRGLEINAIAEWWKSKEELYKENKHSKSGIELQTVKSALLISLPEILDFKLFDGEIYVTKVFKIPVLDEQGKQIEIDERRNIPIKLLSDGEKSIISIVTDIARRLTLLNPDLQNPCHGSGIVLIDELDLHLHPRWQRIIVSKLRDIFPEIQFICTSHSPFIVQSMGEGELIKLDGEITADYSNKSIEDVSEDIMDVDIPQRSRHYVEMMMSFFTILTPLKIAILTP
jgi:predicted ATP-binding protein involved in virulence